jgi:RNA polymerase sigma-70 factor (ECF subfamily)
MTDADHLKARVLAAIAGPPRPRATRGDGWGSPCSSHCARQTFVRGADAIPWIYAIARRLLVDSYRRRRKEVLFETAEADAEALDERLSGDGDPDELAVTGEMAAHASAELSRLPEPQRAAYELVRIEGLSVAEAADVLGTTTSAVKQRLYRVYEALRCALGIGEGR